ncbi:hypothetical protein ACJJTC_008818 [Scirpophaga incertulas]
MITYDPNYNYEDEDRSNDDKEMEDESVAPEGEPESDSEEYSDDDDMSWKKAGFPVSDVELHMVRGAVLAMALDQICRSVSSTPAADCGCSSISMDGRSHLDGGCCRCDVT